jgi:hypothetical protein
MKKHFLILLVFANCVLSFSQNKKIDSVYMRLKIEKADTSIIKSHIYLCTVFNKLDLFDSAYAHGKYANKLSIEKKNR